MDNDGGCSWVLKVQLQGDFQMDWMSETESRSRVTPRILACTPGKTELPVTKGAMPKSSLVMGWKHWVLGSKGRSGLAMF